jgi:hypothetical protein
MEAKSIHTEGTNGRARRKLWQARGNNSKVNRSAENHPNGYKTD